MTRRGAMTSRQESTRLRQKMAKQLMMRRRPKPKKKTTRTRAQQKKLTLKRSRKRASLTQLKANPDFRERTNFPLPPVEEIERRLRRILTPGTFATRHLKGQQIKLRDRILTLPVMAI